MLIEGNKNVNKAKIIPKDVIDNSLYLRGHHHPFQNHFGQNQEKIPRLIYFE